MAVARAALLIRSKVITQAEFDNHKRVLTLLSSADIDVSLEEYLNLSPTAITRPLQTGNAILGMEIAFCEMIAQRLEALPSRTSELENELRIITIGLAVDRAIVTMNYQFIYLEKWLFEHKQDSRYAAIKQVFEGIHRIYEANISLMHVERDVQSIARLKTSFMLIKLLTTELLLLKSAATGNTAADFAPLFERLYPVAVRAIEALIPLTDWLDKSLRELEFLQSISPVRVPFADDSVTTVETFRNQSKKKIMDRFDSITSIENPADPTLAAKINASISALQTEAEQLELLYPAAKEPTAENLKAIFDYIERVSVPSQQSSLFGGAPVDTAALREAAEALQTAVKMLEIIKPQESQQDDQATRCVIQ